MVTMDQILKVRAPTHFCENPRAMPAALYGANGRTEILSLGAFAEAKREITSWPGYAPTPLRSLKNLAARVGVAEIAYKDEAGRFGLGSFKAIGGAYAVCKLLRQKVREKTGATIASADLTSSRYAGVTEKLTVTCATDGNHGRAVAWGAQTFGCRCVIYVHQTVSEGRCRAIEKYGAEVRRVAGTYDDAVRRAASDAATYGWFVVSDTSYEGYSDVPRDVMQGYSLMADEALAQGPPPSHVFVQGGVGGLAAGQCAYFWERLGLARPHFIVVEPDKADCLYRSAVAGKPAVAPGTLDTIMAGLACGEVSLLAWQILQAGADGFMTIADSAAIECMRLLAEGRFGDPPIVAGESAVAGLAGVLIASADPKLRRNLKLGSESRILVFGTEGATDPDLYTRLVGRTPEQVGHIVEVK
jgi:diaminopropionate ammonia-lyase